MQLPAPNSRGILIGAALSTSERKYRVHLIDEATVVTRGERVRVWFLEQGDALVRAHEYPGAEVDSVSSEARDDSCPPGTIWQRSIELMLPAGHRVLSRVTSPLVEKLSALEYLTKERRHMRRHVEETWFVVSGNYRLMKLRNAERPGRAPRARPASSEPR